MARWRFHGFGLHARVTVYIAVLALLFLLRGPLGVDRLLSRIPSESDSPRTLIVAGADLAPTLMPSLLAAYRREYPKLDISTTGGGSAQALEALINRQADVALLSRSPSGDEQALFRAADEDTALWFPVALGGIVVLAPVGAATESLSVEAVRGLVAGADGGPFDRLYVPDPNLGTWDAARTGLGIITNAPPARVVFLKDEAAVIEAVAADPRGAGLASSFSLPVDLAPFGVRALEVAPADGRPAAAPGYEEIAYGEYPLIHHLIAACRAGGSIEGSMFVTYLTSDRGQRQIERAGVLPARHTLREIVLTRGPIGKTS
jgi:DNA-binding transcriptional LysR family regulator